MTKEFGTTPQGAKPVLPTYADRVAGETARIEAIKAQWTPPDAMAAAPMGPAAGPKVLVPEYGVASGGTRRRVSAHWREADVFDVMEQAAIRQGDDAGPFTPGQVAVARQYRHLTENHQAAGLRCASLEAGRSGGGAGGCFIDAFLDEGKRLAWMERRIGNGVAMAVRRVRPSARGGSKAGIISDRQLVDAVCLGQMGLNDVLRRYGWAVKGDHRRVLRVALSAALDRMRGYHD